MLYRLWQDIAVFDERFSRFKKDSELTKVNLSAGSKTVVTPQFLELLEAAQYFAALGEGYFNPFVLPAVQRLGYVGSLYPSKNQLPIDYTHCRVAEMNELETGTGWVKLPLNTALDFGGIGKGFLADKLADTLSNIPGYWLSIGGDIVAKNAPDHTPWRIAIQNAQSLAEDVGYCLHKGNSRFAVATSGLVRTVQDRLQPHCIDPHTSLPPKGDTQAVSAFAKTGVAAEVSATVALLGGEVMLSKLLEHSVAESFIVQSKSGSIRERGKKVMIEG